MSKIVKLILSLVRLYLVGKVIYMLYVNYNNFDKLRTGEFLWYCLFLLFDIWLINVTHQLKEFNEDED